MIPVPLLPDAEGRVVPTAERFFATGKEHYNTGDIGRAEHCFVSALRLDPNHAGALSDLSSIVGDRRQYEAALAMAQRAANLAPEHPAYIANLGVALFRTERYAEASALLMKAISIAQRMQAAGEGVPTLGIATLWHNLGLARMGMSRPQQAVTCFEHAMKLAPDEARMQRDYGIARLATGNWGEGLVSHEARWSDLHRYPVWDSGIPRWEGQDLSGRTIIVHAEQGFGDSIQFCRFLPWLKARGARVIAAMTGPLMRLMTISGLADEVIDISGAMPPADYHSPIMSVPVYLDLTTEAIPTEPYLRAPEGLGMPLLKPPGIKLLVGLVWAGSSGYVPDLRRSMPFEALLRLVDIPDLAFVSLQKGERAGDIARAGATGVVSDLSGLLGDFADTAAALMQIDLLISVDTSVLHLAGALGRPAIALLSNWRCWRWMTEREDTPWYPSVTLATQTRPGDWSELLERVHGMIEGAEVETEMTVEVCRPLGPPLTADAAA
jgi:Glycosyltransferase family 9 (heptosyltransferase)/Tetratricopeptide repeat